MLNYQIDEGNIQSEPWTGSLAYNETETYIFAPALLPKGDHVFKAYTSDPNGIPDQYPDNDTLYKGFYVTPDLDVKMAAIIAPENVFCEGTNFSPEVLVENPGQNTIISLTVGYKIDNDGVVTMNWSGYLEQNESPGNAAGDESQRELEGIRCECLRYKCGK